MSSASFIPSTPISDIFQQDTGGKLSKVIRQVLALCALARKDLRNRRIHAYWRVHCVYAQKPHDEKEA
ncbi:hypothetical protein CGLO_05533 [Colletotrichum gloeosporioides Cg-14]|uniref:Uncharacterized protein n=1 Tax=Colletotrichum gloeosporioides (strain Cg-14) TaxID=1237896 RepID=T0M1J7_COLGC|nr:hypothetical protein CGLO_05533 [Colletotrichum gloeosporioides Cg-14]